MSAGTRDALWGRWPEHWSPTTRLCALAIADVVNDMHGYRLFASVESLAVKAGCTRRAAQYALRQLELDGWLRQLEERPGRCSVYRWMGGAHPAQVPAEPAQGGADPAPHRGADSAHEPKKPKMNLAGARASEAATDLAARFPTNRTADRAACEHCADTGWTTVEVDGKPVAVHCTHAFTPARPVDITTARERAMQAMGASREALAIANGRNHPCPTSSPSEHPSTSPTDSTTPQPSP